LTGFTISFVNKHAHHANTAERYIGTLQGVLIANLRSRGNEWPQFLPPSLFAMNTLNTSSLANHSPYAIHYKTTPPPMDNFKLDPIEPSCSTISEYLKSVKERFAFVETQTT
jgi:hypothetical protein